MRGFRVLAGVVAVVVGLLVVGGGVALATPASFGGSGEESGQFKEPRGIAVEQESGDFYVVDRVNDRVERFGSGGEFLFAWGWGVADGHTQALQTCTAVCYAGLGGAGAGEFDGARGPEGVAVDNDPLSPSYRDVYVVDPGNNRVEKFDPEGHFLLMFGGEVNATTKGDVCLAGESCQAGVPGPGDGELEPTEQEIIAVDVLGTVFVGDFNRVQEFSSGGAYAGKIVLAGGGQIEALAVTAGDDVYVHSRELPGVREYDASGSELSAPRDELGAPDTIALGASGELFVDDLDYADGRHHILEFDSSGSEVESFDSGPGTVGGFGGIALSEKLGVLYVLNNLQGRSVVLPPSGPVFVVGSESGSELEPTTATVGATLNAEGNATTYSFEYGTSTSYGSTTTPTVMGAAAFEDETVSAALSGLRPSTTYHFRVLASNSAGTIQGPDETFTTRLPVLIDSESVADATTKSATLAARLNPLGRDTHYRFEYGTSTAYGSSVPVPDGDAGSGMGDVSLGVLVEGLSPTTVYHYRVVAYNSYNAPGTTVEGLDRTFTTQGGEGQVLPDERAWEMVSPPNKHGNSLEAITEAGGEIQAAADGSGIAYVARGPIDADPKGNRSFSNSQILAKRGAGGWSSEDIATPNEAAAGIFGLVTSEYRLFSPDLSDGLVEPVGDTRLSPEASERTPYLREASGEYTPLVTPANVPAGTKFGELSERGIPTNNDVEFRGASPDLKHVVLSSSQGLTPGVAANTEGAFNLFEWTGGSLRPVSVLQNGKSATEEEGGDSRLGQLGSGLKC